MPKANKYSLKIYEEHQNKNLFMKDSKFDLLLALDNELFPIHQNIIDKSQYLLKKVSTLQNSKIVFLDHHQLERISSSEKKTFIKVLASLYGHPLQFSGNQQVEEILRIAHFLQISEIQSQIYEHLINKFEEYDVIFLYKLSKKYQIQALFQRCLQQLILYKYEHLQINKFTLLNSDQQLVAQILTEYQILKSRKIISKGPSDQKIRNIVLEYNSLNSANLNLSQILSNSTDDEEIIQKVLDNVEKISSSQKLAFMQIRQKIMNKRFIRSSNSVKQGEDNDKLKISHILQLNSQIFKRSKSVCEQIRKIGQQINNSQSLGQSCQLKQLTKKMKQFQNNFTTQQKKLRKLSLDLTKSTNLSNFYSSNKTSKSY